MNNTENSLEDLENTIDAEDSQIENLLSDIQGRVNNLLNLNSVETRTEGEIQTFSIKNPINWNTARWKVSDPLVLTSRRWLGLNYGGIRLNSGFYKIEYTLSSIKNSGSGLAVFDPETRKFIKLITWHALLEESKEVHIEGNKYIQLNSQGIVGIINTNGEYRPEDFWGVYLVTIHKLHIPPN